MKKEIKHILGMLVMVLPLLVGLFFYWLHSPMYKDIIAEQRQAAQIYLQETYYHTQWSQDREAMIKYYSFTDDEINPGKVLEKVLEHFREVGNN